MSYTGIPDPRQVIGTLACDHNKALRFPVDQRKVFSLITIQYNYTVQP